MCGFLYFFFCVSSVAVLEMGLVVASIELHSSRLRRCIGERSLKEYAADSFLEEKVLLLKKGDRKRTMTSPQTRALAVEGQ